MTTTPKWSTPERKAYLVKLFLDSGGFCTYGLSPCKGSWQTIRTIAFCQWRLPRLFNCPFPSREGRLCRFKPSEGKPHLHCKIYHATIIRWQCGYGDYPCYKALPIIGELGNLLWQGESQVEQVQNRKIREWANDARSQASIEWKAEQRAIHSLGERSFPLRGRYNNISQDIFHDHQEPFYLEGIGIDALRHIPVAKVRIASTYISLWVDIGDNLKPISKNARHKAIRYGKPLPKTVTEGIHTKISQAVRDYKSH